MNIKYLPRPEKWILLGIPVLFAVGTAWHFLYELWENPVIGLFAAVNESVWEHLKMVLLPMILYWTVFALTKGRGYSLDRDKWFTGALAALLTALAAIPLLYYFYTEAFGTQSVAVDVAILLAAVLAGQGMGLHIYRHADGWRWTACVGVFLVLILIFVVFTFRPPHLPIFRDGQTGMYGIG